MWGRGVCFFGGGGGGGGGGFGLVSSLVQFERGEGGGVSKSKNYRHVHVQVRATSIYTYSNSSPGGYVQYGYIYSQSSQKVPERSTKKELVRREVRTLSHQKSMIYRYVTLRMPALHWAGLL